MYSENGTAGERGTVEGVSGWWRVEVGLQGARSPFSWLGVASASRPEGSMNGLCVASWCGSGYTMYECIRVVLICAKQHSSGAYFCDETENPREQGSLSISFVELANEGHGENRASRQAGDGADCGRE